MSAQGVTYLINLVQSKITTGGRLVTGAKAREVFIAIIQSYSNLVDGGLIFQAEVGYTYIVALTDPRSFAHKKYVDDSIAAISAFGTDTEEQFTLANTDSNGFSIVQLSNVPLHAYGYFMEGMKLRVGNGGRITSISLTGLITFDDDYTGQIFDANYKY